MINSKYAVCQSLTHIFVILLYLINLNSVRSECSNIEWECDNGECISEELLCNGKVDCRDRSDEIAENCIHFHKHCPEYAFRCAYGACVNGDYNCTGVQDCADNSDELTCVKKDDSDFQGICSDTEMQCLKSKECINSILLCDGTEHCEDGSDESVEVCIYYGCHSFGFQCGNGGCISGNAKCNGIRECADGSDEAWALCGTPRKKNKLPTSTPTPIPPSSIRCQIPDKKNLRFKLHPQNQTIEVGSYVENYEIVHIECKSKYSLKGQPSILCNNGEWNYDFPTCDGYCDGTLLKRLSLKTYCELRDRSFECPKKIVPGTFIRVNCAFGYTREMKSAQILQCLADGSFDHNPERCDQTCGRTTPRLTDLSKSGFEIDSSDAPWHVAIYENTSVNYIYKCGGSIISPTIVITAAHCFWDEANSILNNYTGYQIIAGRNSSNYTTEQNLYAQVRNVYQIHTPIEYEGKKERYRDDIAFLKLETPLKYSETIAPICLSTDLRSTGLTHVLSNTTGYINGFGSQNQLERLTMTTLEYHECVKKSPKGASVAYDKFCIYNTEGSLVCRGDSGGGFFFESTAPDTNEIIYRLWGVISNTPTAKSDCTLLGDKSYVAITNIFNSPSEFKRQLKFARKEDEDLF